MVRHYFVSSNIDELEQVELELENSGIEGTQIHVLSNNDLEVENHNLHPVEQFFKRDIIHSMETGLITGCILSSVSLIIPYLMSWTDSQAGWLPFVFLSVLILGFCTWEGGFIGIQKINDKFKRFEKDLAQGKHVLLVDIEEEQDSNCTMICHNHSSLIDAGYGKASPKWALNIQNRFN